MQSGKAGRKLPLTVLIVSTVLSPVKGHAVFTWIEVIRLLLEQEQRITEGLKCYERREFGRMIMDKNGN